MNEIWLDIPGYEYYQVSNMGNVKSLQRFVNGSCGSKRLLKERILKARINVNGYYIVTLYHNSVPKIFSVHRLVYEVFCGEIPEGFVVNHINECKTDNRLENLNLMTIKENCNWGTAIVRKNAAIDRTLAKAVIGYDEEGNVVCRFKSCREAGRNGFDASKVSACCRGEKHYHRHRGLIWEFA